LCALEFSRSLVGVDRLRFVLVIGGGALAFAAIGLLAAPGKESFDWNAAVGSATAYGTLALALVTWRLVQSAKADAHETRTLAVETKKLAQLAEREQQALVRPFVYGYANRYWAADAAASRVSIPLENGGAGIALNVTGNVYLPNTSLALASTTIASGNNAWIAIRGEVPDWNEVLVHLTYADALTRQWDSRFKVEVGPDGRPRFTLCAYGIAEKLPPPSYKMGWDVPNGTPVIELPDEN
jgi:hypothetical protein